MLLNRGLNTFYEPLGRFEGLSPDVFTTSTGPLRFRLRRDAGTFDFAGRFEKGRGTGRFEFTADSAYANELARRGIGRPTPAQQFSLGRHDVTLAYLDELTAQQYTPPTVAQLDRAGMSSADLHYIRSMAQLGYRMGDLESLVRLSDHSVTPRFVRELTSLGYEKLPANDLIRLRNHSITADFVRRANAYAGRKLTVQELVAMGSRSDLKNIDLKSVRDTCLKDGKDHSTPYTGRWTVTNVENDQALLEYFWADGTNWRRWIPISELVGLDASRIGPASKSPAKFTIEQSAGRMEFEGALGGGRGAGTFAFTPNRDFVDTLRTLGIAGLDDVTDHNLKNLTFGSLSAASVRGFRELGFTSLTLEDLQSFAIRQVTPGYVKTMRELGVSGLDDVRMAEALRFAEVPIGYVRELVALGYRGIAVRDVIELRQAGVTAAFIKEQQSTARSTPSVEALLEARKAERERSRRRS